MNRRDALRSILALPVVGPAVVKAVAAKRSPLFLVANGCLPPPMYSFVFDAASPSLYCYVHDSLSPWKKLEIS